MIKTIFLRVKMVQLRDNTSWMSQNPLSITIYSKKRYFQRYNQLMKSSVGRHLCLLLLISTLLTTVATQRGGSRSSSSSSSSSSHRHRTHYYHTDKNCTTINGTTTCTTTSEEMDLSTALIILAVFIAFVVVAVYFGGKEAERRKKTIDEVMKDYDARSEEFCSTLSDQERAAMIDTFMKRSYTMVVNIRDKAEKFFCQIKVTDLKKENDIKYSIKMNGSDEVGKSTFEGLLIFRGQGMGFKLSKVYNDRTKAEQTGKFDILLYEGQGNADKVEGEWAFKGFESSTEYAGTWIMMEL